MKRHLPFLLVLAVAAMVLQPAHAIVSVELVQQGTYYDSLSYLHIIGIVHNTGDAWVQFVRITTVLTATNGTTLDVLATYALPNRIPPGGIAGFDNIESGVAKAQASASASSVISQQEQEAQPVPVHLTIIGEGVSTDTDGFKEVVGVVKNNGTEPSTFTKVIGLFSTTQGNLTYLGFTYTDPNVIPPGAQYGFKLILANQALSSISSHVTLFAESEEYTSVPEFPWPFILLSAALTLGVVELRRCTSSSGRDLRKTMV
jgi:hypothetical protein